MTAALVELLVLLRATVSEAPPQRGAAGRFADALEAGLDPEAMETAAPDALEAVPLPRETAPRELGPVRGGERSPEPQRDLLAPSAPGPPAGHAAPMPPSTGVEPASEQARVAPDAARRATPAPPHPLAPPVPRDVVHRAPQTDEPEVTRETRRPGGAPALPAPLTTRETQTAQTPVRAPEVPVPAPVAPAPAPPASAPHRPIRVPSGLEAAARVAAPEPPGPAPRSAPGHAPSEVAGSPPAATSVAPVLPTRETSPEPKSGERTTARDGPAADHAPQQPAGHPGRASEENLPSGQLAANGRALQEPARARALGSEPRPARPDADPMPAVVMASSDLAVRTSAKPSTASASGLAAPPESVPLQVEWLAARGGGSARVRLHPPHLGEIELRVRIRGNAVEVVVSAPEEAARAALHGQRDAIADGLATRALRMEHFEVGGGQPDLARGGHDDARSQGDPEWDGFERRFGPGAQPAAASRVRNPMPPPPTSTVGASHVDLRI